MGGRSIKRDQGDKNLRIKIYTRIHASFSLCQKGESLRPSPFFSGEFSRQIPHFFFRPCKRGFGCCFVVICYPLAGGSGSVKNMTNVLNDLPNQFAQDEEF